MKTNYQSLTINERLHVSGLMEEFDLVRKTNHTRAVEILRTIEVDEGSINEILE